MSHILLLLHSGYEALMEVTLIHKKCIEKQLNRQLKAELPSVCVNTVEPGQERAKPIILLYQHIGEAGG